MTWVIRLVDRLKLTFNFNKVNSPANKNKVTGTVNGDQQIIQTGSCSEVHVHQGISRKEVQVLVNEIHARRVAEFKGEAIKIFDERAQEAEQRILNKLFTELPDEHLAKLKDPSAQLSLSVAIKNSGLLKTKELQELLANLVVKKISSTGQEQKIEESIYQRAITILPELTTSQLKILTLWLLTVQWNLAHVIDFNHFATLFLENGVNYFLDFNQSDVELLHLTSIGCANILTLRTSDLGTLLNKKYPSIFPHVADVESLLSGHEIGRKLVRIWKKSLIRSMTLTPLGLAIAITYFDQIKGSNKI